MPAATVRADYDQLKQVASTFRQNVEATQRTLQNIRSNVQTLQGGDWIGQGANAFYQEMDQTVVPTLQRLINALDSAANSTGQISSILKNAEDQAANVLKGPGGGTGMSKASGASAPAGTGFGMASGLGAAAGPMGAPSAPAGGFSADVVTEKLRNAASPSGPGLGSVGADALTVKQKIIEPGMAGPQAASNVGPDLTVKQKIMGESAQVAGSNIGLPQMDASSKDAAKMGMDSVKGGLANEGWERVTAKLNPTAANIADGTSNTAGSKVGGEYEWIKASGAGGPAGPQAPGNVVGGVQDAAAKLNIHAESEMAGNIGFPQADAASKDAAKMGLGDGSVHFNQADNTIGGAAQGDLSTASGHRQYGPSNFKVGGDLNTGNVGKLDGMAAGGGAANTIGGATAHDSWLNTGGGAPPAGGANTGQSGSTINWGDRTVKDGWINAGGGTPPAGGNLGGGLQTGGANTIGGAAASDDWAAHAAGSAPSGGGSNLGGGLQTGGAPSGGGGNLGGGLQTGGANTIGGVAGQSPQYIQQNSIQWGEATDVGQGQAGAQAEGQTPSVGEINVQKTFNQINISDNLTGGAAADNWSAGSGDNDKDDH